MLSAIRNSIGLKVSLTLVLVTIVLTVIASIVIIDRQSEALKSQILSKAILASQLGAQFYGNTLDEGIDNGYITANDVFDTTNYEEIKGYDFGDHPKFHTKYDFYTDARVTAFQDSFLQNEDFLSATGADVNTYIPTHNSKFQLPVTGNREKDLTGNRTKRKFDNPVARAAVTNKGGTLTQDYIRDDGRPVWDVSTPIYVKGKHWGAFRVLVTKESVLQQKAMMQYTLGGMFALFALAVGLAIFFLIQRSMAPLVKLSSLADEMSAGEQLDKPIKPASKDEVGRMAKSLDRLRASLKAAMDRLGE